MKMFDYLLNIWKSLFPTHEEPSNITEPVSRNRKKPDTTKLTQYMYDYIVQTHIEFLDFNRVRPQKERRTLEDLTIIINTQLKLDKSRTTYSHVWCGRIDRTTLAKGTDYFNKETPQECET